MIEIKMRKFVQDESWTENLEKYLPKNNFGALKYILETTLVSPVAPSVSLYFYDIDNIINNLIGSGLITYKYELIITKNNIKLFGGFVDPKSVNRDVKEKIISFTILSYRYALKFENGEEIYDRYYEDSQGGQTKVWHNFKSTNYLVNQIYDKLNSNEPSIVVDKFIDHYHLLDSSEERFLSFRNKDEISNMPENAFVLAVLNDPNNKNMFAIFTNEGYHKGNFDIGFRFVANSWCDSRSVEPANWINQDLDSVAVVHARHQLRRTSGYGDNMNYWDTSDVAYLDGRELCLGVRNNQNSDEYARDIVIGRRQYSGGSWGAWSYSVFHSGYSRAIILPVKCTHVDSRTGKWYSIFRDSDGWVWVERWNSDTSYDQSFVSNDTLFSQFTPYEEIRLPYHNAKLINQGNYSFLFMLRWDTQELIVFNPMSEVISYYELAPILGSNVYWNLESLTYNRDTNEYFSWVLEADGKLSLYKGLPYQSSFEKISAICKLDLGPTMHDDPDNWNPVEVCFRTRITDTYSSGDFGSDGYGFFQLNTVSLSNIPNGDLMSSIFFNEFGNYCQFATRSLTGDIIISNGDFTNKTYSDVIKDLALNSRSVEYIDENQKMFFFDRRRVLQNMYELRTAADNLVCNVAYITYADKLNLDPGLNSYTVECLCSLPQIFATNSILIHDGYTSGADCWMIYADNSGIIKAKLSDTAHTKYLDSGVVIEGTCYIVLEIDRELNLAKLYVNGILKDSEDITSLGAINSITDLCIGRYRHDGGLDKAWNGYVREVRITRQALRQNIITAQNLEFNGWDTLPNTVAHWNFNEQNTRDLTSNKNFLTIRQHGSGYLNIYWKNELLKLHDITNYLSTEIIYTVWENYFDGIKVSYADGDIEIGQTDPGKSVFNISVNYIYVESQARIIAESYYNFFNTRRNKLECEFFNFYPVLYKYYIVNNKICVCIEAIHYHDNDRSVASFVEVE